jgi:hypothetical protein
MFEPFEESLQLVNEVKENFIELHPASLSQRDERKRFGTFNGFNSEIDVQIKPIEMIRIKEPHILNCRGGRVSKPRKVLEREKTFLLAQQ